MRVLYCERCDKDTEHAHKHNEAHGISGTHMTGSERFECFVCGNVIGPAEGKRRGIEFILDKEG